jgi:arylsulfatase A
MKKLSRRDFIKVAGLTSTAFVLRAQGSASSDEFDIKDAPKPNIILIMADDLGYGHLGCYGQQFISTPNIDQMAKQGMRFTQMYSGCTVCAPSRTVLMTGLHTGHTYLRGNTGGISLREKDITIAKILKKAGYATGMFGKWGLGDHGTAGIPGKKGFDEFFGYLHQLHAHEYYPEYLWENDTKSPLPKNKDGQRGSYAPDLYIDRAIDFINRTKNKPFFCYIPTILPHVPLHEPAPTINLYRGKFDKYGAGAKDKEKLAAMITHLDEGVGKILKLLKDLHINQDTIIIFTSDNGAQTGYSCNPEFFKATGPLRGAKEEMYEGSIRVPFVVRWPGRIRSDTVSDYVGYFPDIMPTFADLAGVADLLPKDLDGLSILPILEGQPAKQKQHQFLYWESPDYDWPNNKYVDNGLKQAVRMGNWKAVRSMSNVPFELYDLSNDIGEHNNLAEKYPDVIAKIQAYIKQTRTEMLPQTEPVMPKGKSFQ